MRNAMRFCDPPRGKCESCAEFGDFPWKVRNADGTWDFLRGKYEMPCGLFDFLSRKDENPIRLCNLEFSRSKIALPCVPTRCATSGIIVTRKSFLYGAGAGRSEVRRAARCAKGVEGSTVYRARRFG